MTVQSLAGNSAAMTTMRAVLARAELPTDDLEEGDAEYFAFGDHAYGGIVRYGTIGLLRSVVVNEARRGSGTGRALLAALEDVARARGIAELWLLTTSAEKFFARNGFVPVSREEAPEIIAESSQFRGVCPASAALMRKRLA